jgi:hypothetical protein
VRCSCDHLQHPVHIARQFVVPEPDDTIAKPFDCRSPLFVMADSIGMLTSVDLNDQLMAPADKIADITSDRHLAAEFGAA